MPDDRGTENTVREVLQLMSRHPGEWMRASDVSHFVEHSEHAVAVILSTLADGYVLSSDGDRFRYVRDPLVDMDIQRFLTRSAAHSQHVQNNVALFRNRYGQR